MYTPMIGIQMDDFDLEDISYPDILLKTATGEIDTSPKAAKFDKISMSPFATRV
jgi:hypothetical protein